MYTIYIKNPVSTSDESLGFDRRLIYSPVIDGADIYNINLTFELSKSGSLTFTMPPTHDLYNSLRKLVTFVEVYKDNNPYWRGRVLNVRRDITNNKSVTCEGVLALLNDILILYNAESDYNSKTIHGAAYTLSGRYNTAITDYANSCSTANRNWYRRLRPGTFDLTIDMDDDTTTSPTSVCDKDGEYLSTTLDRLNRFVEQFDGYLFIRYVGDDAYIDFTNNLTDECSQTIEFGKNLIELDEFIDGTKLCTGLWISGTVDNSLAGMSGSGVTIDSEGDYNCYIHLPTDETDKQIGRYNSKFGYTMFNEYGRIDNKIDGMEIGAVGNTASVRSNINAYAASEFKKNLNKSLSITISAVDLSMLGVDTDEFEIGKLVRVVSKPHGIYEKLLCSKISLDLANPENNQYTIGDENISLTSKLYGS